jgi:hypothetical protein
VKFIPHRHLHEQDHRPPYGQEAVSQLQLAVAPPTGEETRHRTFTTSGPQHTAIHHFFTLST